MGMRYLRQAFWMLALPALLTGCDPTARHRFLTTFFNEVPTLPPMEQYCEESRENQKRLSAAEAVVQVAAPKAAPAKGSSHPPYEEKRCKGCHQENKTSVSGLIKAESELCFVCHPKILKHRFAHGPAAEGACLGCHLPHEAGFPSLLARDPGKGCDKCHGEPRLARAMHDRIKASGVFCQDCHDPHSGTSRYFLK